MVRRLRCRVGNARAVLHLPNECSKCLAPCGADVIGDTLAIGEQEPHLCAAFGVVDVDDSSAARLPASARLHSKFSGTMGLRDRYARPHISGNLCLCHPQLIIREKCRRRSKQRCFDVSIHGMLLGSIVRQGGVHSAAPRCGRLNLNSAPMPRGGISKSAHSQTLERTLAIVTWAVPPGSESQLARCCTNGLSRISATGRSLQITRRQTVAGELGPGRAASAHVTHMSVETITHSPFSSIR